MHQANNFLTLFWPFTNGMVLLLLPQRTCSAFLQTVFQISSMAVNFEISRFSIFRESQESNFMTVKSVAVAVALTQFAVDGKQLMTSFPMRMQRPRGTTLF